MHERIRTSLVAVTFLAACAMPVMAQKPASVLSDLMTDLTQGYNGFTTLPPFAHPQGGFTPLLRA